ncbi:IS1 family transposase, partial [Shigella sonnei]|uniref:IS1 family transposase n=1 Tax=Shigella sonnei TaxID=624 RepID=UPI0023ECEAE4
PVSSRTGGTADRNRSHWSTSKTPSYTKSVSWQHHPEMDEQWGYVGAKSRQRWLFYAYDSLRKTVVAHVFGERTMATLGRLMSLLSPFDVVIWMTDGWPLYESRLKGKLHVISKRYTQRIERHNLNLRQHLARLGRKSLSFSKSVELHDKVIGHYLNIKHYQ